ncbi:arabinose efflux permease [bacterium (Candidatus Blackallbacteria) CG17_big_fil_post_rev_8_21_14_2_50_48_46]|uniref:Arabinose efflux permease n=1 Tax=bacterium (Candidatus Blackallbacteria) CG17_big_fil_post_rev_8_21_14_2_50_48_46 TaxID=2014261 RepID=A0A2M7GA62_9BACT|nr:MAG: arabinose efflux permease [bacterium (Candidatus Blackallbacteria) CG18_big_fil_WC_8_21_14_2_50_49_26]PIW19026.1 MAG: arabinose efflux permease [bacterium (Candidatus Blackallbacteria) CG17_big_fil_post_rev_8_21_14_2_50_48_46]PIW44606.1 MAG: arabinose efflux permease [bacterium (Candidatus Blackallbacteria) CG13_big_fil_rev_8_21_14_2_50_49_14]
MRETEIPPTAAPRSSFRAVWRNQSFMRLWLGQVFSQLADKVILVYLIVLLVATGNTANSDISRLTLVFTIPAVLFGSLAGVFVDRWNKKWLMIISNALRGVFVLALPLALFFGDKGFLWIYAMTFLISTVTQFFAPAEIAMIPTLIERHNLLAANSLFTTTMLASVVIGFGVGDPILRMVGDHYGHLAIGGMYFVSAIFLVMVHPRFQPQEQKKSSSSVIQEMKEGFQFILKDQAILFSLLRLILLFSAFAALTILVIGFVEDVLRLEKRYFGYLLAVSGLGMGLGAGMVGRFGSAIGKERLIFTGFLSMGSVLTLLSNIHILSGALGFSSKAGRASGLEIAIALLLALLLGLTAAGIAVPLQTMLQEEIPEGMRGKVFGVQNMLINTALTLPMSLAGISADLVDNWFPGHGVEMIMTGVGLSLIMGGLLELIVVKKGGLQMATLEGAGHEKAAE